MDVSGCRLVRLHCVLRRWKLSQLWLNPILMFPSLTFCRILKLFGANLRISAEPPRQTVQLRLLVFLSKFPLFRWTEQGGNHWFRPVIQPFLHFFSYIFLLDLKWLHNIGLHRANFCHRSLDLFGRISCRPAPRPPRLFCRGRNSNKILTPGSEQLQQSFLLGIKRGRGETIIPYVSAAPPRPADSQPIFCNISSQVTRYSVWLSLDWFLRRLEGR